MIFTSPISVEETIIELLKSGSIKTTELIIRINESRHGTTKQAVYTALRKLRKDEIVITHGMRASLSVRWLRNVEKFLQISQNSYHLNQSEKGSFHQIKEKERVEYYFNNLLETDAFWWQALYQFINFSSTSEPVYIYNPHEWFLLARRESELEVINSIILRDKQLLLTTGSNTLLDKYIAKDFDGELSQYFMSPKPLFKKDNYYLNIVDDFLIEAWIDQGLANKVEKIYTDYSGDVDKSIKELDELIHVKSKGKLRISRNSVKASKIKKTLGKHFYIKK